MPHSPRDSSKNAVLVPPKLSSELELRSTFLGQFWRYSDGIFSKVTRRTVAFSPIIQGDTEEFQKPPVDLETYLDRAVVVGTWQV